MPDQARCRGHANQKHHGSDSEQETDQPNQQTHYRSSVSALAPKRPAFSSAWQPTRDGSYFS
jgi:hypothetical protein